MAKLIKTKIKEGLNYLDNSEKVRTQHFKKLMGRLDRAEGSTDEQLQDLSMYCYYTILRIV